MRKRINVKIPDADDPRSLSHPSHREQWLELARAIGRMEAREEFANKRKGQLNDNADRRSVRKVLKRPAKRPLD